MDITISGYPKGRGDHLDEIWGPLDIRVLKNAIRDSLNNSDYSEDAAEAFMKSVNALREGKSEGDGAKCEAIKYMFVAGSPVPEMLLDFGDGQRYVARLAKG